MSDLNKIIQQLKLLNSKKQFLSILKLVASLDKNIQHLPQIILFSAWAHLNLNQLDEALNLYLQGIEQDPHNTNLLTNCGKVYFFKKNFEKGIQFLEKSLQINSQNQDTIIFLARSLFEFGKKKQSFKLLELAINANLSNPAYYFEISNNFFKMKEYNLAIKFYLKVIQLNPDFNDVHLNLAICYQLINNYEKAEEYLVEELKKNPNNYLVHFNLGNIYREMGRLEDSYQSYLEAIKLNPNHSESYRGITIMKKLDLHDPLVIDLQKITKEYEQNNDEQSLLSASYALSKIYEDNKKYKESYNSFSLGNSLRRKQISYSSENTKKQFQMIKELFSKNFISNLQNLNSLGEKAIFILGMPRSGTTLAEQVITRHPDVSSGGELTFLQSIIKKKFPKADYDLFSKDVEVNLKDLSAKIGNEYISSLDRINNHLKVTDKLPFNFIFIGFIKTCLPKAKIVHCTRNAKDTCISILKNYFPLDDVRFAHNEKEIIEYYSEYKNLMSYWKSIFGNEIYDLQYEKLVSDSENEIKKLIKYLDLDWNENCLNQKNNKNIIKTIITVQARQPIYKSSVNFWENYADFLSEEFLSLS